MTRRVQTRTTFGSQTSKKGTILHDIAESRIEIEQCRLLTLQAAALMDSVGAKAARQSIAMIKVAAPNMAVRVFDRAIQAHGGLGTLPPTSLATLNGAQHLLAFSSCPGVTGDLPLARYWSGVRTLRLADGTPPSVVCFGFSLTATLCSCLRSG
jgi:acyl-CoA dehydrogenase